MYEVNRQSVKSQCMDIKGMVASESANQSASTNNM